MGGVLAILKEVLKYSWANPLANKEKIGNNKFKLSHIGNNYRYVDIYQMVGDQFYGEEVIQINGNIKFIRKYSGGMFYTINKTPSKNMTNKTFKFLQKCLMLCAFKDYKRGPSYHISGQFEYFHSDYKNNTAYEIIKYNGTIVHYVVFNLEIK